MRFVAYYLFFLLTVSSLCADVHDLACTLSERIANTISCPASVKQSQEKGEYKAAITELQTLVSSKPSSDLYLTLAVCQLQDQQEEEAFKTYLKCLEMAYAKQTRTMTAREKVQFDQLLAFYIQNSPELEAHLTSVLQDHPDFIHCQFFLASSSANARKFKPFFYLFYQSFCSYPDSYMSHKTQGVISSLVLQRAKSLDEKDLWRHRALISLKQALELCPQDTGLHKMIIYTASDAERKDAVIHVINEILKKDVKLTRTEIPFYINHAIRVKEIELAEVLLDKAKTWYEYSRIIQEMQMLLAKSKSGTKS